MVILLVLVRVSFAGRMALVPLSDISQGQSGINLLLTRILFDELEKRGFEVISEDKVFSFLVRHRIRWLGYIDRLSLLAMNREIGADLVLMGTVTQLGGPSESVGLILYLFKAEEGKLVWSKVAAYSKYDVNKLLGLSEVKDVKDLVPRVLNSLLSTLPNGVRRFTGELPVCEVKSGSIVPRYVKGGEEVTCFVKLKCVGEEPESVYLRFVGDGLVPMKKTGTGYVAKWKAPQKDGRYPVKVVMEWNHGSERSREFFLCSYWVDNQTPDFIIKTRKGTLIGDKMAFSHHIILVPKFSNPEVISRWSLRIVDDKGNVVVNEHKEGNPPRVIVWRGQRSDGGVLNEGNFTIVLKVWDRAGNEASDSKKVILKRVPPDVRIEAFKNGRGIEVNVEGGNGLPISYWRMGIRDKKGNLLKVEEGKSFPVKIEIPSTGDGELLCDMEVRDILGNRKVLKRYMVKVKTVEEQKNNSKGVWVENF
ncbi:hypothetical protein [Thermosulfidibacter takaii]|nr:hypothetical protein [Thermosulfidibacter takaii]